MTAQIATARTAFWSSVERSAPEDERVTFDGEAFRRMVAIERKRTERSGRPFLLMLLEADNHPDSVKNPSPLDAIMTALRSSARDTDVVGWYKERTTVGVMFTEIAVDDKNSALSAILGKVGNALQNELTFDQLNKISFSFHFFPDDWNRDDSEDSNNPILYPDLFAKLNGKRAAFGIKRLMDIAGSTLMLVACSPLFVAIAAAIKASSSGPVFFKQRRVGQCGRCFTFLKFRSMQVNSDHSVHREYVRKLIAGSAERMSLNGRSEGVYKLVNDTRITTIGKFLRRTSLDELPQFLNVLMGDMSLVGPRPPLPYELSAYQTWHRRRLLQVKPGITGLWQINGRSRVAFDDMVRMDLHYATSWSPWLDFKILMSTPGAVVRGAY